MYISHFIAIMLQHKKKLTESENTINITHIHTNLHKIGAINKLTGMLIDIKSDYYLLKEIN